MLKFQQQKLLPLVTKTLSTSTKIIFQRVGKSPVYRQHNYTSLAKCLMTTAQAYVATCSHRVLLPKAVNTTCFNASQNKQIYNLKHANHLTGQPLPEPAHYTQTPITSTVSNGAASYFIIFHH